MIKDGQVVIVDEFTGRLMPGRRWSDGLHQAVEAKEKVKIERENQTLATITFQNYFRKYKKLSGMTGTADTEAGEFAKIYKLDVIVIPTNRRCAASRTRPRLPHRAREVRRDRRGHPREAGRGGPCWSARSRSRSRSAVDAAQASAGIKHVVLNAKYHAQEAEIVAQAGRKGAVTIATNMAGRGTDILLGGNPEFMARQQCSGRADRRAAAEGRRAFVDDDEFVYFFHVDAFYRVARATGSGSSAHFKRQTDAEHEEVVSLGGLHIVGTERHEARRIDNQLRGRAGRQGDPGSSRFYLSLEDDLMRIFGSDRISGLMQRLGMEEGVPIEHGMVTRAIERAQKQVEAQNFAVRKHLLEYDDVMNKQRESVYTLRREILEGKIHLEDEDEVVDTRGYLMAARRGDLVDDGRQFAGKDADPRNGISTRSSAKLASQHVRARRPATSALDLDAERRRDRATHLGRGRGKPTTTRESSSAREILMRVERDIMLQIVDAQWKDHLYIARPPEGRHRPARLRPARSARRVQEGKLRAVPGHEGARIDEEMVRYLWWLRPVATDGPASRTPSSRAGAGAPATELQQPVGPRRPRRSSAPRRGAAAAGWAVAAAQAGARVGGDDVIKTVRRDEPKVGRNDPSCRAAAARNTRSATGARQAADRPL